MRPRRITVARAILYAFVGVLIVSAAVTANEHSGDLAFGIFLAVGSGLTGALTLAVAERKWST